MTAVTTLERGHASIGDVSAGNASTGTASEQGIHLNGSQNLPPNRSLPSGLTLDEAQQKVREDDLGKWDVTVPRNALNLYDGRLSFQDEIGNRELSFSPWATGQFCNRLGIPAPYFRKCPLHLQDTQANYWLREGVQKEGEQWLLRAREHDLRAVLSERYSPLDNRTLLDELHTLLPSHYRVDWFGISDESLHLRVVDPARYREVLPNDALTVGIHLANSEVGFRSVTVDALVYRLVCTNGLIRLVKGKSLMRQRHLHVSPTCFVGALGEAIECALQESESFLEELQRATQTPVPHVVEVMEKIGEKWHLSEEVQQTAQKALLQEPASQQESLYGLVNAYTAAAQRLPDEMRYDLEVLAGNLAQHGVAAYAPKIQKRIMAMNNGLDSSQPSDSDSSADETASNGSSGQSLGNKGLDIIQLAREMFQASVVQLGEHYGQDQQAQPEEEL